jgi:hypothetical protein
VQNTSKTKRKNSQIWRILNEVPVTEMVDSRELRWFGHLIVMDNNRKCRHLLERRVKGLQGKGRVRVEWVESV